MTETLQFPFAEAPPFAEPQQVADGIYWLRMPLPMALDHVNIWLMEDGDGWTIIDTGMATEEAIAHWQTVFAQHLHGKPVKRVIVTHMHPDHAGLAGWLCQHWQVELWMSRTDYLLCLGILAICQQPASAASLAFYRAAGLTDDELHLYHAHLGGFGQVVRPLPASYRRMQQGDVLTIGKRQWQVVVGTGHAPEHISLYCPDERLFIAGDQILPGISSNISVLPYEPLSNPLQDWIDSCQQLAQHIDPEVLALPSHELPFRGVKPRWTQLWQDHETLLQELYAFCAEPRRAVDAFPLLFSRPVTKHLLFFAVGESLAHFNCLLARGQLRVERDSHGVDYYQQAAPNK